MRPSRTSATAGTPRMAGYSMPAEWTRHEATWLAWPHDPITWPDRVPQAEDVFVQMAKALSAHERVELLVRDETEAVAKRKLAAAGVKNVRLHRIPTADSWIRDYGPCFVKDGTGRLAFVDWVFNAWGNKYDTLLADNAIPPALEKVLGLPRFEVDVVMEGGSIDVNGAGCVLTTEQCLLNKNRNPALSKSQIEEVLRENVAVDTVLWLGDGIEGDDTDGHIDDIARFVAPDTIMAAVEADKADPNHAPLMANLERLRQMRDASGRPFRILQLPMPGRVETDEGDRLPASYANFYIGNGVVLLPVFGHANDKRAQQVVASAFPTRTVVPIRCEDLVWGMGTIHCVTQQQPAPGPA